RPGVAGPPRREPSGLGAAARRGALVDDAGQGLPGLPPAPRLRAVRSGGAAGRGGPLLRSPARGGLAHGAAPGRELGGAPLAALAPDDDLAARARSGLGAGADEPPPGRGAGGGARRRRPRRPALAGLDRQAVVRPEALGPGEGRLLAGPPPEG